MSKNITPNFAMTPDEWDRYFHSIVTEEPKKKKTHIMSILFLWGVCLLAAATLINILIPSING